MMLFQKPERDFPRLAHHGLGHSRLEFPLCRVPLEGLALEVPRSMHVGQERVAMSDLPDDVESCSVLADLKRSHLHANVLPDVSVNDLLFQSHSLRTVQSSYS